MKKRLVLLKSLSLTFIFALSLFLNCSTVYAAAAPSPGISTPFNLWPQDKQDPFRKAVEQFIYDLFGYSPTISYVDNDGSNKTATASSTNFQIQGAIESSVSGVFDENGNLESASYQSLVETNRLIEICLDEYCKAISKSSYVGLGKYVDGMYISFSAYEQGITNILNRVGEGVNSGVSWGLDLINGVPHNSITVNQDYVVTVFDFLGLDYKMFTSPNNLVITTDVFDNTRLSTLYYTPFFITKNNDLYILYKTVYQEYFNSKYSGVGGQNRFYLGSEYYSTSFDWEKTIKGYLSFRFFSQDTSLYLGVLSCYSSSQDKNNVHWNQYIISDPEISYTPILFDDRSSLVAQSSPYEKVVSLKTENQSVKFFKASDGSYSTKFDYSDILDEGIAYCGYFYGDKSIVGYEYSNIQSAGQMLLGTENAISGGGQTITSELSDWQKAIYILAQQQGTTYEELLEKMDMIIDSSGNVTLVGLDGVEYSISELTKSFDEIFSQVENISGDLSDLLEYLKSLNIEGLGSHIAALEGTLNDLNERDKEREAVYGDMLGKLDELNNLVGNLNLDDLKSISTDISEIKNLIKDFSIAAELDITESINKFETPSSITTKFPFSLPFDVYNIFNIFSASPQAPKFTIHLDFTSIGGECYDIVIDLSQYEFIANIIRWVLYAVFIVGLIVLTNKLIGRG